MTAFHRDSLSRQTLCHVFRRIVPLAAAVLVFTAPPSASGQYDHKSVNPTGILFVAECQGDVAFTLAGQNIEPVTHKSYPAEGIRIAVGDGGYCSFVLSNGTALVLRGASRISIPRFVQEPFVAGQTDLGIEPSSSETAIQLDFGQIGLCSSAILNGSHFILVTDDCKMDIRGGRFAVNAGVSSTSVAAIRGQCSLTTLGESAEAHTVHAGRALSIARGPNGGRTVADEALAGSPNGAIETSSADAACLAKKTVAFQQKSSTSQEVVAARLIPALSPVQYVVSPALLN